MEMQGKAVLITGASSGVGFAAAEAFAGAGADVALLARGREGLERAAARVRAQGRRAVVVPADLSDRAAVDAAVGKAVRELGTLHVLCSCAAITVFGGFEEVEPEDFDRVVDVTFGGVVNVVRAALPELEQTGGRIVAMGSLMSKLPLPQLSSYAAAKHAERGFLNTLHVELKARRSKVRVAQLHPGAINTPVWGSSMASANGFLPRKPPEGYSAEQVAQELVRLAENPAVERTFGLETKAIELLFTLARPAGDLALVMINHYFRSGRRLSQSGITALREAVGEGVARDGIPFERPSITRTLARVVS
jgi:NAD(P)-dependent dehydrogenase (short-subunit alcohol dehydrogenase family)